MKQVVLYKSIIHRWKRCLLIILLGVSTAVLSPLAFRLWAPVRKQGSKIVQAQELPVPIKFPAFIPPSKYPKYGKVEVVGSGLEEIWYIPTIEDSEMIKNLPFGSFYVIPIRQFSSHDIEQIRVGKFLKQHVIEVKVGWPFKSFTGVYSDLRSGKPRIYGKPPEFIGSIKLPNWLAQQSRNSSRGDMPVQPIWRGLLANAAIFTSLWGMLLWLQIFATSLVRGFRGMCRNCGYDLRGNIGAGCPECGWRRNDEENNESG